ncbi:MAG TPA: gluconeogenesis factor YvcK family protein [Candidatus Saccharimonadia bacterium]|nr:gluconeogenesis factor YvcK family protein [Candidatus Saccharimonadia bacterium]
MPNGTGPKVVVIGGGTGTFTLLTALKHHFKDITAIVNMTDDGGSTGILRDELGVLPPGDVRQCLVALSESDQVMRDLFTYRYTTGTFKGHSFGNLFLTTLEKVTGSFAEAVEAASGILAIQGKVVPVTTDNARLILETADGRTIYGEDRIGEGPADDALFSKGKSHKLYLNTPAKLNPAAATALAEADLIVIAPGKLYSSIIPLFLIDGMKQALIKATGKKVYVCNLMTRPTQTAGFTVEDFAAEIERYIGEPVLDYVIYNTEQPSETLLSRYAVEGEQPVLFSPEAMAKQHYQAVGEPLIADQIYQRKPGDTLLKRTLIRHDSEKVAGIIKKIAGRS